MDLCADQLLAYLPTVPDLTPSDLETPFRRRFQRLPILGRKAAAFNADRVINRHLVLPRHLRRYAASFDFVHVVDHSYAHVVASLPPGRAGVYCHDLDAFRSILKPIQDPRPAWFRYLARRILRGLQTAVVVFHNSRDVGRQLIAAGIIPAAKLVHTPLGVAAEFTPDASSPISLPSPGLPPGPFLLHVGSHDPRKRIDVLLEVFAAVRKRSPGVKLVQVGPPFAQQYAGQINRLGIGQDVRQFTGLMRNQLADLYRRAAVVLVPSEAEGFGLPVIESLACGGIVVASDIPVLREVGGEAVVYRAAADIPAWADAVARALAEPGFAPPRNLRLSHASRYSWREHARVIGETYLGLMESACSAR
jgi:glycosyltransferase involved in cell wall biosynthesis